MNTIMNEETGIEFNVSLIVKHIKSLHNDLDCFLEYELIDIVDEYLFNWYGCIHFISRYYVYFQEQVYEMFVNEMMEKNLFNTIETDEGTMYFLNLNQKTGK